MASTLKDARGHPVSGGNTRSLEIYEQAMQALQCYTGDPVALVDRAIEEGRTWSWPRCSGRTWC